MVFINLFALWAAKAALLVFLYEIFPRHLWKPLHMASGILIVGFVSNLVGSAAWCRPAKLAWKPDIIKHPKSHGYCFSKGDPTYNTIQFTVHVFSTLVVVLLPILLLYRVPARRSGELAFALSSLSFGIISVAASAAAFASLVWMMQERHALLGGARHATMISLVADQNAIFLGACLNVIRIWKNRDGDDLEGHDTELTTTTTTRTEVETKGLVIEVERRWSVHVDIVESWGHGWRDPWEQRSGHEMVL